MEKMPKGAYRSVGEPEENRLKKHRQNLTHSRIRGGFFSLMAILLWGPVLLAAQPGGNRMVLIVESNIRIPGGTGDSCFQQAKGHVLLVPRSGGKFYGSGDMLLIYTPRSFGPSARINAVVGFGHFDVRGEMRGGQLRFWIQPGTIELEGEIVTTTPMGTERQPYISTFDPSAFAMGRPDSNTGVRIDFRDGATKTVDHYGTGKTIFTLHQVETWQVKVKGVEIDQNRPGIPHRGPEKELGVAVRFEWELSGIFYLTGQGDKRRFLSGWVSAARVKPVIQFDHWDLYDCKVADCPDQSPMDQMVGVDIAGKAAGGRVRLFWPNGWNAAACVQCRAKKSYLRKKYYSQRFGKPEFLDALSRRELPLVDGRVIQESVRDWLLYTITLRKAR